MNVRAKDLEALRRRLAASWSIRTSSQWRADDPARGQCSVTALAVQQLCGGEILKTPTAAGLHFYNLIGGARHDFTAEQFEIPPDYLDQPSSAEEALADTSAAQLEAMLDALR